MAAWRYRLRRPPPKQTTSNPKPPDPLLICPYPQKFQKKNEYVDVLRRSLAELSPGSNPLDEVHREAVELGLEALLEPHKDCGINQSDLLRAYLKTYEPFVKPTTLLHIKELTNLVLETFSTARLCWFDEKYILKGLKWKAVPVDKELKKLKRQIANGEVVPLMEDVAIKAEPSTESSGGGDGVSETIGETHTPASENPARWMAHLPNAMEKEAHAAVLRWIEVILSPTTQDNGVHLHHVFESYEEQFESVREKWPLVDADDLAELVMEAIKGTEVFVSENVTYLRGVRWTQIPNLRPQKGEGSKSNSYVSICIWSTY